MEHPISYHLARQPWQLFCTFTFREAELSTSRRKKMYFAWLRQLCEPFGVYFPAVPWCLRMEDGELTGRRHLHSLVSGFPPGVLSGRKAAKTCLFAMHTWETLGGGHARVRRFNPSLPGVDYVLEGADTPSGADVYELNKFSSEGVLELTLSYALQLDLLKQMHESRRRLSPGDERLRSDLSKRLARPDPKRERSSLRPEDVWPEPTPKGRRG